MKILKDLLLVLRAFSKVLVALASAIAYAVRTNAAKILATAIAVYYFVIEALIKFLRNLPV